MVTTSNKDSLESIYIGNNFKRSRSSYCNRKAATLLQSQVLMGESSYDLGVTGTQIHESVNLCDERMVV